MNLFELFATLSLDTSEYEQKMGSAESTASKIGSKIASGIGTIAKGTAIAVGATATAVGALVKSSVEAYADYEQLVGGVETLFGTQGQTWAEYAQSIGISAESSKAEIQSAMDKYHDMQKAEKEVLQNASEAYKTAGMSANEYMETVTSFSASLISSLDGDTKKASEQADKAIVQMSDNANKMGTSLESISNAYRGFARGNFTMLDNLSLGFSGTKEGMQQLLEKATELSGVEFDIESYSDIIDAIGVIQDNMGITGTTAREASETISGSIGMMKSAWENLITGMSDENADFGQLVENLVDSVGTVAENILPRVEIAINGAGQLVETLLPVIVNKIPSLINNVLPNLLQSAVNIVTTLVQGIAQNASMLATSAVDIIMMLAKAIIANLPTIIKAGIEILLGVADGIVEALPDLIPTIVDVIILIVDTLIDNIDKLAEASLRIIVALAVGLIEALPKLIERIPEIIIKIVAKLIELSPKLFEAGGELIGRLAMGIIGSLATAVRAIIEIADGIRKELDKLPDLAKEAGLNLIMGLWNGINDKIDWVIDKIKGMGESIMNAVKGVFGIASPSKEFKKIGAFLAEGLGLGWEDEIGDVTKQITSDLDFAVTPITASPSIDTNNLLVSFIEALGNQQTNVNVVLEGDTRQFFKAMQTESYMYSQRTGSSAFA